jgi:DNA polymerase III epsilon subunit-like protein
MIHKFYQFINEHKLVGKTITEMLWWLEKKSSAPWVFLDTETTGLPGFPYDVQLTQVSCIVARYDAAINRFQELESMDRKIKLTSATKAEMGSHGERIKKVLSFNHYGQRDTVYREEGQVLGELFELLARHGNPVLVIQNASFDMRFLNTRSPIVTFDNDVIDTKQILQLFYLPCLQRLAEIDPRHQETLDRIGTSARDFGLPSSSLGKIGPVLGLDMTGYHDALTDCRLMMAMLERVVAFLRSNKEVDITRHQAARAKVM